MDYLILIDALNPVPAEPVQLSEVCGVRLEHQAAEQLKQMLSSAEREGVRIKALSGYRSPEYQQRLWEAEVEKHHLSGLPLPEAERLTARTLARPGHSEHNCGLAVDLCTPDAEDTQDDFFLTPQSRWLCRSAHRYGFILRYPRMKEHLTGIAYEPWHYRYVGAEAASIIRENGLCLEEFLHFYSDFFFSPADSKKPPR